MQFQYRQLKLIRQDIITSDTDLSTALSLKDLLYKMISYQCTGIQHLDQQNSLLKQQVDSKASLLIFTQPSSDEHYFKRRVKHIDDNRSDYNLRCLFNMQKKIKQLQKGAEREHHSLALVTLDNLHPHNPYTTM